MIPMAVDLLTAAAAGVIGWFSGEVAVRAEWRSV
jgi:hypothetical protein